MTRRLITVLYVRDTQTVCSVARAILQTCRTIERSRFRPLIAITATGRQGHAVFDLARAIDAPAFLVPSGALFDPRAAYRLLQLVRGQQVDIVQTHDAQTRRLGFAIAACGGVAHVPSVEGWIANTRKQRMAMKLDQRLIRRASRVVTVSGALKRDLIAAGVAGERIDVVHNAVLIDDVRAEGHGDRLKRVLDVPAHHAVVTVVGRLSPEKGHAVFLSMAQDLVRRHRHVTFLVAGDGPCRLEIEERIGRLRLGSSVRLLGHCDDMRGVYAASDVVVSPSFSEGLPNAILESFAFGKPVVATRVGGVPELVEDGVNGLLVAAGDAAALTSSVAALLQQPRWAQALGASGRALVNERFSLVGRTRRLERLYETMVAA